MSWVFTQENMLKLLSDKIKSYKKIVQNVTAFQAKKKSELKLLSKCKLFSYFLYVQINILQKIYDFVN